MKGFYQKIAFFLAFALFFSSSVSGSGVFNRKLLDKSCMSEWLILIVSVEIGDKNGFGSHKNMAPRAKKLYHFVNNFINMLSY